MMREGTWNKTPPMNWVRRPTKLNSTSSQRDARTTNKYIEAGEVRGACYKSPHPPRTSQSKICGSVREIWHGEGENRNSSNAASPKHRGTSLDGSERSSRGGVTPLPSPRRLSSHLTVGDMEKQPMQSCTEDAPDVSNLLTSQASNSVVALRRYGHVRIALRTHLQARRLSGNTRSQWHFFRPSLQDMGTCVWSRSCTSTAWNLQTRGLCYVITSA